MVERYGLEFIKDEEANYLDSDCAYGGDLYRVAVHTDILYEKYSADTL
ncbi:MAG: hypothetical protein K2F97_00990 [Muribaculaceae bacterium]|nr:hypothetical protein [Muribaculaceae bacterium]